MSHGGNIAKGDCARGAQSYAEVQHISAPWLAGGWVGRGATRRLHTARSPRRATYHLPALAAWLLLSSCRADTPALEYEFREPYRTTQAPHHEAWAFELLPRSHIRFRLRSGKEELLGTAPIVSAQLSSTGGLEDTQGSIVVDLQQLQLMDSPHSPPGLTEQSLGDWLGLDRGREPQFATFRVRELGRLSAPFPRDGRKLARSEAGGSGWRIDGHVTGDLTFHGFRLPYTTAVRALFRGAEEGGEGSLRLVEVATRSALPLQLDDHGFGSLIASFRNDVPEGSKKRSAPRLEVEAYLFGKGSSLGHRAPMR